MRWRLRRWTSVLLRGGSGEVRVIALGVLAGVVSCVPPVFLLERVLGCGDVPSIGAGLVSVLGSFVVASAAIFAFDAIQGTDTLVFGTSLACAFLAVWAIESVRAWRDANPRR